MATSAPPVADAATTPTVKIVASAGSADVGGLVGPADCAELGIVKSKRRARGGSRDHALFHEGSMKERRTTLAARSPANNLSPAMYAAIKPATILIVEDSAELVALLTRLLADEGYAVESARDGDEGLAAALEHAPDLLILDVGLPRRDGLHVIGELRRRGIATPTLMLTAFGDVAHRVQGLDAGADDYLAKPFDADELAARVRALLRRASSGRRTGRLRVGDVTLDALTREVRRGDRVLVLTQREFALLEYFMRNAEHTLSRAAIAEHVWHSAEIDPDATNVVDVYVAYLRRKLEQEGEPAILHTVRGQGYVLRAPSQD
jgi:DNA-binding response OmpR family regulator